MGEDSYGKPAFLLLSRDLEIDLPAAFAAKMRQNAVKYPVEKAKGVAKQYTEL